MPQAGWFLWQLSVQSNDCPGALAAVAFIDKVEAVVSKDLCLNCAERVGDSRSLPDPGVAPRYIALVGLWAVDQHVPGNVLVRAPLEEDIFVLKGDIFVLSWLKWNNFTVMQTVMERLVLVLRIPFDLLNSKERSFFQRFLEKLASYNERSPASDCRRVLVFGLIANGSRGDRSFKHIVDRSVVVKGCVDRSLNQMVHFEEWLLYLFSYGFISYFSISIFFNID
jgi:hypothetical protein